MGNAIGKIGKLTKAISIVPGLGYKNVVLYAEHRVRLRSGYYERRLPIVDWSTLPPIDLESVRNPFSTIDLANVKAAMEDPEGAIAEGGKVLHRRIRYFSNEWRAIPDSWRANPHTGYETSQSHWSRLPDFDGGQGDIKWIWEPSRFDWVSTLARAYAASGDDRFAECFWVLFEDWRLNNRPNSGINWKDGQECSFRMFAMAFADGAFRESTSSTPVRRSQLWQTVAKLAERVETAAGYARSQRNNHGLSESVALFLAGVCLPSDRRSARWRGQGKRCFEQQVLDQFFDDGGYIQHSFIYQRLAMRDAAIWLYIARFNRVLCAPEVTKRLMAAVGFMFQMVDVDSGAVPIYGANDGANVFSLSGADYLDFRPSIQTLSAMLDLNVAFGTASCNEELAWLGLEPATDCHVQTCFEAKSSGYYVIRDHRSFGLMRCHSYHSRPGHADMLGVDLWIDGQNVVPDPGTFQYFDPSGLGDHLKGTAAHNTVEVNGHSQMTKFSRFLWLDWTRSALIEFDIQRVTVGGEHYGYLRSDGVLHRRQVFLRDGNWAIVDDLIANSQRPGRYDLRWRLAAKGTWIKTEFGARSETWGYHVSIFVSVPAETTFFDSRHEGIETASSRFYGAVEHTALLGSRVVGKGSVRWITIIGSDEPIPVADSKLVWHDCEIGTGPGAPVRIL